MSLVIAVIGLTALVSFVLSVTLVVFQIRRKRVEPLPNGDYVVTIVETCETLQGSATVFRIDEPKEFQGRTVTMVKGKSELPLKESEIGEEGGITK